MATSTEIWHVKCPACERGDKYRIQNIDVIEDWRKASKGRLQEITVPANTVMPAHANDTRLSKM